MSSYQIIKLKNGEDLICNVLDNENGRLKVSSPLKMETVNRLSKKGLVQEEISEEDLDHMITSNDTKH